jgi:hypothetical protein
LCLFFLAINVTYVLKIAHSDRSESRSAFQRWGSQIRELAAGENIWTKHIYPNPPMMAVLLMPLMFLPPFVGALAWFYLKVAMAVLALHWVLSLLDVSERPFPWWGKLLAILLCLRPIEGDLVHGNVNLFILFLVVAALVLFCRHRDALAGLTLGLAIACKITPALFVPYFLWKRAWTALAASVVGTVLFTWVVPGLFLGWSANYGYVLNWYDNMVQPFADGKITSEAVNQSLPGYSYRMLTHNPSFITFVKDEQGNYQFTPVEYLNVATLSEKAVQWLIKGCMGAFALLVIWRCRTPLTDRRDWHLMAEFSVVILGMLLFSERTWKHHCVTLLLPFAVIAYRLSALPTSPRLRWYLVGTLAAVFTLMTLTTTGLSPRLDRFGDLAQVYGAYVWSFVLLLAAMLVLARPSRPGYDANTVAAVAGGSRHVLGNTDHVPAA